MPITISDKDIDEHLDEIVRNIKRNTGMKNVSKTDAIRWLLKMKKQGRKTHKKWVGTL